MKKLSEKNKTLLLLGSKTTGSMIEGYYYVEEQLYINEAKELRNFCNYVDKNIGGCASGNIDMLFNAFKYPNNKKFTDAAENLRKEIEEILLLIKN